MLDCAEPSSWATPVCDTRNSIAKDCVRITSSNFFSSSKHARSVECAREDGLDLPMLGA